MMVHDPKQFVRQWNREIEAETRRLAAPPESRGWRLVLWVAAEIVWAVALIGLVIWLKRLQW